MKAFILAIGLLAAMPALQADEVKTSRETLDTPSFKVTIECRYTEGEVTCYDVKYVGVSKKSGKSIVLKGKTWHSYGADGVTPDQFLGYVFKNGSTTYFVWAKGILEVRQGSKVLVWEEGVWK